MTDSNAAAITVEIEVPVFITVVLLFLIWSTLRSMLILSSEDAMLGVKVPQEKRLNPVVLAAKSDFKKNNTKVLILFIIALAIAMYVESEQAIAIEAVVLPIAQIIAGLWFWSRGRRAIKKERSRAKWWLIGDSAASFENTDSASQSAQDQYAYYQAESDTVPRSFDQLIYPKAAGWLFICSFAALVVGCYALWLQWDSLPDPLPDHLGMFSPEKGRHPRTVWGVFHLPLIAGLSGIIIFLISYWLSFTKPKEHFVRPDKKLSAGVRGLQIGLGMITLVTMTMLNLVAVAGVLPAFSEHREVFIYIGRIGVIVGVIALVLMGLIPILRARKSDGLASEEKNPMPNNRTEALHK